MEVMAEARAFLQTYPHTLNRTSRVTARWVASSTAESPPSTSTGSDGVLLCPVGPAGFEPTTF